MSANKLFIIASTLSLLLTTTALHAQTERQHDAHEHGVSELKIAIDGPLVQFVLEAPGADIVGFEHEAEDDSQKAAIESALALLSDPMKIFVFPDAAGCTVTSSEAAFEIEHHDEHEEEHEGEEHDEKHEEEHEGEDHDDEEEGHAEFHVSYSLTCTSPQSLSPIGLNFFDLFSQAKELEVEAVSNNGQMALEVERDEKQIDLSPIMN